jgi:hypothetical protein
LNEAITKRWNSQSAKLPRLVSLGNEFLPHRDGAVAATLEFLIKVLKEQLDSA